MNQGPSNPNGLKKDQAASSATGKPRNPPEKPAGTAGVVMRNNNSTAGYSVNQGGVIVDHLGISVGLVDK